MIPDQNMWFTQGALTLVIWVLACFTFFLLLKYNRKDRNPLEWSLLDRCLLIAGTFCFLGGAGSAVIGIAISANPEHLPWVDFDVVRTYYRFSLVVVFIWVFILLAGLALRRRIPENRIFTHTVVQFNAFHVTLVCYAFGSVTHPGPFLLAMALGTLNFLLFDRKIALPWIVTFLLLTVWLTLLTWLGVIPYAPVYNQAPFGGGRIETAYLLGTTFLVIMVFIMMLLLIAHIFTRWRDREARVAEMSDLLKKMFGRYLSTEVMNAMIEDPASFELGGERRKVTIMMTDLRGFTAMSERLDPEQVVQVLNTYFEVMVEVILKHNGTINEIIGDALLVIFGAPKEMPDRAQQAIACAISMQQAMAQVNEENREKGLPEIEMGLGLNETEVIVGNIGSAKRSKYAVVGSGVNMASRIESYTVGGQILISESVRKEAGDILRIDSQREVFPKGAEKPLLIYEVGAIAGRFNLALEKDVPTPAPLSHRIPMRFEVLRGKDVAKEPKQGYIVALSRSCAEIEMGETVPLLTNLKMNLAEVEDALTKRAFYGKVIVHMDPDNCRHNISFTAVPPEVKSFFQALRRYATANTAD